MRSISTINDLVRKILFPTPKDTERYFSQIQKIQKDLRKILFPERYLLLETCTHHFRHKIPKRYHIKFTTQPCK